MNNKSKGLIQVLLICIPSGFVSMKKSLVLLVKSVGERILANPIKTCQGGYHSQYSILQSCIPFFFFVSNDFVIFAKRLLENITFKKQEEPLSLFFNLILNKNDNRILQEKNRVVLFVEKKSIVP